MEHNWGVDLNQMKKYLQLEDFYLPFHVSIDESYHAIISSVEAKEYPFYGV